MADNLRQYEFEPPSRRRITPGQDKILYHRVYRINDGNMAVIPAWGAAVDLEGVTGSGLLQPRVYSEPTYKPAGSSDWEVAMTFYQAVRYAGDAGTTLIEVGGSRARSLLSGQRRFVVAAEADAASLLDGAWPVADTNLVWFQNVEGLHFNQNYFPGLLLVTANYAGIRKT